MQGLNKMNDKNFRVFYEGEFHYFDDGVAICNFCDEHKIRDYEFRVKKYEVEQYSDENYGLWRVYDFDNDEASHHWFYELPDNFHTGDFLSTKDEFYP